MRNVSLALKLVSIVAASLLMVSCAHVGTSSNTSKKRYTESKPRYVNYASRLPSTMNTGGRKTIVIDPKRHVWGAYSANGRLLKAGLATAGANWCADVGRPCRTSVGTFSIKSLGAASCKSSRYPKPNGGAPMPYCMFFNGHQGLHGSNHVVEGNRSHGCVRVRTPDARWIRHNFANIGTRVIVKPY